MATTQFKPFALGTGNEVTPQEDYTVALWQQKGWSSGILPHQQINKVLRQATTPVAALTQVVAEVLGTDIADDGDLAGLVGKFRTALSAALPFNPAATYAPGSLGAAIQDIAGGGVAWMSADTIRGLLAGALTTAEFSTGLVNRLNLIDAPFTGLVAKTAALQNTYGPTAAAAVSASDAAAAAAAALMSQNAAATKAGEAYSAASDAATSKTQALTSAASAATSATSASNSASSAAGSASSATTTLALTVAAKTSAESAAAASAGSATSAAASSSTAGAAATASESSRLAAVSASNAATASSNTAVSSATTATTAATTATTKANLAADAQVAASNSATAAASSAASASASATTAGTQASAASASALTAGTRASEALTYRTEAVNAASTATSASSYASSQAGVASTAAGAAAASATTSSSRASESLASSQAAAQWYNQTVSATGALSAQVTQKADTSVVTGMDGRLQVAEAQLVFKTVATRNDGRKVLGAIGVASVAGLAGAQSEIVLQADRLVFVPSSDPNAPLTNLLTVGVVDGVTTLIVPAARIGDLQVGTSKLAANSTGITGGASTSSGYGIVTYSMTITAGDLPPGETAAPVIITASYSLGVQGAFDVSVDQPDTDQPGNLFSGSPTSGIWSVTLLTSLGIGTHVFRLYYRTRTYYWPLAHIYLALTATLRKR